MKFDKEKGSKRGRLQEIKVVFMGPNRLMRRAKRIQEGQAWERKKEGKPTYFGAYNTTMFRKTGQRAETCLATQP
jgi:hypothetical protein